MKRNGKRSLLGIVIVSLLLGCGSDIELPAAKPLSVTAEQLQLIPGLAAGELVMLTEQLSLFDELRDNHLALRVAYPETTGQYPILLFSHGNWADNTKYDNLIRHWVSHGYVVIAPYHADGGGMARGIFNSLRYGQLGLIKRRADDFKTILNNLSQFKSLSPVFYERMDQSRIAATGHSFGAFTAQQMQGAAAYNPDNDSWQTARDDRIKAVVAISPPGPMFDVITQGSWQSMQGPALLTTGTWDVNATFFPQWQLHKMAFDTALPNKQYALVVEGADHYLGNLICRPERDQPPQHNALLMINAVSTTFLNAYLKDDVEAKNFIDSNNLQQLTDGFSVLSQR